MNAHRSSRLFTAALLLLAVLLTPANIFPCAVDFPHPVFTLRGGPDAPLELFAQGRLGIVLPTYYRMYLVVAYRYLSGKPLTKPEQTAVVQAWTASWPAPRQPSPDEIAVGKWDQARGAALGQAGATGLNETRFRQVRDSPWVEYPNCGNDAFVTAAQTLVNLSKKFGAGSAPVRDWVQAQDTVFKNCRGTDRVGAGQNAAAQVQPQLPPPAAGLQDAVLRMDRQYQIAAANFYAGDFQAAAQQFQQIADERDSPWRTWAPYLIARCYIREATLNVASSDDAHRDPSPPSFNVQQMTLAEKQLQSILKNPALAAVHPASRRLLGFVEFRLHPDQRLYEVAQQLAGPAPAEDIAQDLIDFDWLLRKLLRAPEGVDSFKLKKLRDDLAKRGLLDDLTDWMLTFQQQSPDTVTHAVERWRATKSEAWLMAALSAAKAADPTSKTLSDAAAALPQSSPAYELAVYQRARLLIEQNQAESARQLLDANLPRFEKSSLSAYNLLLAQRFAVAADFHQFLEYAPRTPVEYFSSIDCEDDCAETADAQAEAKPLPKRLDGDSALMFNQRLPLSMLAEAATGTVLPSELRAHIATASWSRAAILSDPTTAKAVESVTVEAHPEARDYIRGYDNASTDDARTFAATWMMLHFPGIRPFISGGRFRETRFAAIDDFRDNWWCGNPFSIGVEPATGKSKPAEPPPFPAFMIAAQRASTEEQWRKLSTLAAGPDYMGHVVLDWAKAHPDDQHLAEALHLVVRATRYGCSDDGTAQISKQAFDVLHARYPNSSWAKQTPYWYK